MGIHLGLWQYRFQGQALYHLRRSPLPTSAAIRDGDRKRARDRPPQNERRRPSWIWRFGNAEVKASGVLGVAAPPPALYGRIPCTLNVVNPGVKMCIRDRLIVAYPEKARVFKQERNFHSLNVQYVVSK